MRLLKQIVVILVVSYIALLGAIYWLMHKPPIELATAIGRLPMPVFLIVPFETLWTRARAGSLDIGSQAPDFRLPTLDKSAEVTLASFRGVKPVVLIFGSYT